MAECPMCSGEYCGVHGYAKCQCDTADRHIYLKCQNPQRKESTMHDTDETVRRLQRCRRDHIAATLMGTFVEMLCRHNPSHNPTSGDRVKAAAEEAVRAADLLLAELDKEKPR